MKEANKYHGLENQGATCYLNSVLQVLFMTKDFRQAVKRHTCENPDTDCIDCHLKTLFDDLEGDTAHTNNITKKLGIDKVYEQQDAAEYFEKILSLTSPEASQFFHGELRHENKCVCGEETNTDGPFWHLPLALVDSSSEDYSVMDGIEKFFSTSEVSGENQMYCEKCGKKADATLKSVMKHHPDVLMLLLKRFEFDYSYMAYVKINRVVDVPLTLQIPENQIYELYAFVDHFGDLRSGHYTATIKSDDDDSWYKFNDANVSKPFQVDKTKKSQSAYLLFYRKKKMDAADTCTQDTRMSSPEGLSLDNSDNDKQLQDAVKIRETHEGGGKTGADNQAERRVFSVDTRTDQNVGDQSNYNGGLDDITQKRPQENLGGDVGQNIPHFNDFKQDVSGEHAQHGYLKQDNMSNTQMTDEDGKTRDENSEKNRKSSTKNLNKNVHICQNIYADQEKQYRDHRPVGVDKRREERGMEINIKSNKDGKTGDDELASGTGVPRSEDQSNGRVSDGKQNMPKDNQGMSNMYKSNQKRGEEQKGVTGEKEQERGDDEQRAGASYKQQCFSQGVKDQNNVGFDDRQNTPEQEISVTTCKEGGVEKQDKEQGKIEDNEHTQNREGSSPRQAGLEGRGRQTENQRVGDEKSRHVNSLPKAKSGFKEDTMDVKAETPKGNSKSRIRFIKKNAKTKSNPKPEPQDNLSVGVDNLNLNESKKHKRLIGSVEEGGETNIATDSNAKKLRRKFCFCASQISESE